jgi:hypothetical protein
MNKKSIIQIKSAPVLKGMVLSICAWCYPGDLFLKIFPENKGIDLSHTICPACKNLHFNS